MLKIKSNLEEIILLGVVGLFVAFTVGSCYYILKEPVDTPPAYNVTITNYNPLKK